MKNDLWKYGEQKNYLQKGDNVTVKSKGGLRTKIGC